MDPARIFTESLTPRPELENSLGPSRRFQWLTVSVAIGAERTSLDLQPFPAGRE